MTILEHSLGTYQIVQTPLNEQADLYPPVRPQHDYVDSVQQRMMIILGLVALVVVTAVFFGPRVIFISSPTEMDGLESAVLPGNGVQTEAGNTAAIGAKTNAYNGISPVFSPQVQHWAPQIVAWSNKIGLDPDIAATIMQIESCGDPQAVSGAGAQGLFQVMPFHFVEGEAMLDPDTNALKGLAYYAERLQQTNGDVFLAFAGYNGGHVAAAGNWNSWVNETQRYYVWSKGIYEEAKSGAAESETLNQWMQAGGASLCQQASTRLALP